MVFELRKRPSSKGRFIYSTEFLLDMTLSRDIHERERWRQQNESGFQNPEVLADNILRGELSTICHKIDDDPKYSRHVFNVVEQSNGNYIIYVEHRPLRGFVCTMLLQ